MHHVAQTEELPCLGHPLGPGKSDIDAGRFPGSRVITRCTAFPGPAWFSVRPSGCGGDRRPAANVHRARRLQLQGQPRFRMANHPCRVPVL